MKSCLSIIIALIIIIIFTVTAAVLWYTSSTTKILPGESFQTEENVTPATE